MTKKQRQEVVNLKVIEAIYEVDRADGGFATVIDMGTDTPLVMENCKVEAVLEVLAGYRGRTIKALHAHRCLVTGSPYMHMDYLEISPSRLFMAVPFRRPVNSNHGACAYLNNSRVVTAKPGSGGRSQVLFLSGKVLPVRLSVKRLQTKIERGRKLLYDDIFAVKNELKKLDFTLRRLQRRERGLR